VQMSPPGLTTMRSSQPGLYKTKAHRECAINNRAWVLVGFFRVDVARRALPTLHDVPALGHAVLGSRAGVVL
jgi:hypothetical protein